MFVLCFPIFSKCYTRGHLGARRGAVLAAPQPPRYIMQMPPLPPHQHLQTMTIFELTESENHPWNPDKILDLIWVLISFGQTIPVAKNRANVIVDGNDLVRALHILRVKSVGVVDADGLSIAKARALRRRKNTYKRAWDPAMFDFMTRAQLD